MELYWACCQQKPIICLKLEAAPYNAKEMSRFLQKLETNLVRQAPATAEQVGTWLDQHVISFENMAQTLSQRIPTIITLPYARPRRPSCPSRQRVTS